MPSFSRIILASSAILTVLNGVLAVPVAHQHHAHKLDKREVAYVTVTQDIVEIVAQMATVWVDAPAPTPSTSAVQVAAVVEPTPTPTPTPTPSLEAVVATTSSAQAAATSSSSSTNTGSGTAGLATFYSPGMGSCGTTSSDTDLIVAMAATLMAKTFTGNPNNNSQCGRKIKVTTSKGSVVATIVDTCPGCLAEGDIDLSPSAFDLIGDEADGKIPVTWTYVSS